MVNRVVFDTASQKIGRELGLVFESVNEFRSVVTKYVVVEHVAIEIDTIQFTNVILLIRTSFVIASSFLATTVKG
ncbi:hypothetical protein H5410_005751 [Solanum commersonii]|uniref:Uncharacterized protein n=1 Tax=Solanum commersonii TaxID=4109 RepID=A0A9J6A7H2_SOLCO|nr:hypothetical protein H5410_005751 [Solanum commersonii]